ncbi:hypothetical protein BH23ACT6_BH23ACT6_21760 [soil metagenome]
MSGVRARLKSVKILSSAFKHGSSPADLAHAISSAWHEHEWEPDKWLYIGVDGAARPLEIVTVQGDDGAEVAAMADQAEAGYDLGDQASEPNPHFQRLQLVPADLLEAIDERAHMEG